MQNQCVIQPIPLFSVSATLSNQLHLQAQTLDLVASSALASKVTLPSLSKDVIDALQAPKTVVSSVTNGFLPTMSASAKPATTGATLTLNVTEVCLLTAASSQCTASTPLQKVKMLRGKLVECCAW